jgi:hypothetical protein
MITTAITLLFLANPQSALASTTQDTRLPLDPQCRDEAIILRNEGPIGAGVYWPVDSWMFQLHDFDGDGFFDFPAGVDALTPAPRLGAQKWTPCDLAFSSDASFDTFLDGDVLRMLPDGGIEVLYPEAEFTQALQQTSGSFDLDALSIQGDLVWFSVKDKLQSTSLGTVEDGDILLYDSVSGQVTREYSEAQVQTMVNLALGSTSSIADVRALSFYPPTGELVFTVQSPTAEDASVFGVGNGGRALPSWHESDWDFQVSTELDALAFQPSTLDQPVILSVDVPYVAPRSLIKLRVRHGSPNGVVKGVFTRSRKFAESDWSGIQAIYLDQLDPLYQIQWNNGWMRPTALDGSGSADYDWTTPDLPGNMAFVDNYFQVLDLDSLRLSNPIVIRLQ